MFKYMCMILNRHNITITKYSRWEIKMNEKNTKELDDILKKIHISDFDEYCCEQGKYLNTEANQFPEYMKKLFKEKKLTQQVVFLKADIPERYGYKLLSGEKRTKRRDIILRICYAAELTLEETQRALRKYEMPQLYAKIPRDALLMLAFNERPGGIIDVNELLKSNGMEMLRTSGVQE